MKLYNTLSKKIEDFKPLSSPKVNIFVCGPTVYDFAQLGNAKTYIQMDVLVRVLRSLSYEVKYLQNITDIDDKIIARADENGISWDKLSRKFESEYHKDMEWLENTSVDEYARATEYIEQIINQVERLSSKGHAYTVDGDGVYFEISTFSEYGKLSGRREIQENDAQSRIDQCTEKRGWNDFCIWKFSKPGEPVWEASFGAGRPGWHIEDTAIAEHFFGFQYDIHGGAVDLIFPHHEAELTLMESLSNKSPFVGYWAHAGFLTIDGSKMGKSEGNHVTIRQVKEKGYDPAAVRVFMLQSHYRSEVNFTWELLDAAAARLKSLQDMADLRWQAKESGKLTAEKLDEAKKLIISALENDLGTPEALKFVSQLESGISSSGIGPSCREPFGQFLEWLDDIFGRGLSGQTDINSAQKAQIDDREKARSSKDWAKSDQLRDNLLQESIVVKDTDNGAIWSRVLR